MQKSNHKFNQGYSFLELVIVLSLTATIFLFFTHAYKNFQSKFTAQTKNNLKNEECNHFFLKTEPWLRQATSIALTDNNTLTLKTSLTSTSYEIQINLIKRQHHKNLISYTPTYIKFIAWYYWNHQQKNWQQLSPSTPITSPTFLKAKLLDQEKQTLDTYIFSCPNISNNIEKN